MKPTIEDMIAEVTTLGDRYIIFSELDFDHWGDSQSKYSWYIHAYRMKLVGNRIIMHKFEYHDSKPFMALSKYDYDADKFETAKDDYFSGIDTVTDILRSDTVTDILRSMTEPAQITKERQQ